MPRVTFEKHGSNDGNLYALPASCGSGNATCTPLWHATTGNAVDSSPGAVNGVVYVGSNDGNLYAFDLTTAPLAPTRPNLKNLHPKR
jgi:outer membrane protein assembly factor BamB